MLSVYFGHDERARSGTTVFVQSVIAHAGEPLALIPITRAGFPGTPEGSNAFTLRRFLVPWSQQFRGWALFADGADMLCRVDLNAILAERDEYKAVQVVKHDYQTKHPRKYVGAAMESDNPDYWRKNWASVMLINCGHYAWREVRPESVARMDRMELLQLRFIPDPWIGDLDARWNWLADEYGENPDANIVHYTAGIPGFAHYRDAPMAAECHAVLADATTSTG